MAESITIEDAILQGRELSERAFSSLHGISKGSPDSVNENMRAAYLAFAYDVGVAVHNLRAFDAVQRNV
jgi:hypothetical protein